MIKYFRFSWHEVVWEVSWVNLNLLIATIPSSKKKDKNESDEDEEVEDFSGFAGLE